MKQPKKNKQNTISLIKTQKEQKPFESSFIETTKNYMEPKKNKRVCVWKERLSSGQYLYFDTECEQWFYIGLHSEEEIKYCPFCGKKVRYKR